MTPEQRSNLEKLATYLESLPSNYSHFDMSRYTSLNRNDDCQYALKNGGLEKYNSDPFCGTVACAAGHGPAAGVLVPEEYVDETDGVFWTEYADAMFGSDAYDFCFSAFWETTDNTHHGAAARIRYYLEHGEPDNFLVACLVDRDAAFELYLKYVKEEA